MLYWGFESIELLVPICASDQRKRLVFYMLFIFKDPSFGNVFISNLFSFFSLCVSWFLIHCVMCNLFACKSFIICMENMFERKQERYNA